jgi:hypothetical protein
MVTTLKIQRCYNCIRQFKKWAFYLIFSTVKFFIQLFYPLAEKLNQDVLSIAGIDDRRSAEENNKNKK